MLSRRNIRIKTLQQLYAFTQQEATSLPLFTKQLDAKFKEFFQFYYYSLKFLDDFNTYLESEKEIELAKYFPNKNFIRSTEILKKLSFFNELEKNEDFSLLCNKIPFSWKKHGEIFNRIFTDLVQYDFFIDFNVFDSPTDDQQKEFLTNLYEYLFNECELFESTMEEEYTFWDDDSADVLKAVIKIIDSFYAGGKLKFEQINAKQREDIDFGIQLFEKCIINKEMLDEMIQSNAPNWDPERLTVTDMLMLRMALSEFLYFETIPPKVTINEYLDIAKAYSTPKSHLFINGVLDKLRISLTDTGKIQKSGRGLIN
ncbi:MAG: transcription antitermination factor NusB [Bacteroidota bacterium]